MISKRFFGCSRYLALAIVLVGLLTLLIPVSVVRADSVVTFPDPNLEAAVRDAIDKPTGDIDQSNLVGLSSLEAASQSITNLGGLEYCTALTNLNLNMNEIGDLSPLSGLTSLTNLYLGNNLIDNLTPLSSLTSLRVLALSTNEISYLSPLSGLTSLTVLGLGANEISDISPLAGLTSLTYLDLFENQISDILPLAGLTSLWGLCVGGNGLTDISPLAGLTNLVYLHLGNNQIADISPLAGLTSLEELFLYGNQIADISPLAGLTNLSELLLDGNQIGDIAPLSGLTNLTYLTLGSNQISDIEPLVNNPGLSSGDTVYIMDDPLSSVSVSTYIPALQGRGVTVYWDAANQAPDQPSNTAPSNGAGSISLTPTLSSSAFSDPDAGDTHAASQWQVRTAAGTYGSPVSDSGTDTSNLTGLTIPSAKLNYSKTYYWRVRYQDNHGEWSSWSAESSFVTANPRWDINQDGKVDYKDLAILGAHYGCCVGDPCYYPPAPADINEDGCIDYKDLAILGAHYGEAYRSRVYCSEPRPDVCPLYYDPVIGSDGQTYGNGCASCSNPWVEWYEPIG